MDNSESIFKGFVQYNMGTVLTLKGWTKEKFAKCTINEKTAEFDYAIPQEWLKKFCEAHPEFDYDLICLTTFSLYFRNVPHLGPHMWSCCWEINNAIKDFNGYK